MPPKTYHTPLRSSMSLLTNIVTDKHPWTLKDILRAKKQREARRAAAEEYFATLTPAVNKRFAVITKCAGGFHVVGMGNVPAKNLDELKIKVKKEGYTHIRHGAIKTSLENVKIPNLLEEVR